MARLSRGRRSASLPWPSATSCSDELVMNAALLLLADGRLPSGGHAHSAGLEQAVADGRVTNVHDVSLFARGALLSTGLTSAALAAISCAQAGHWALLCAEFDARTP